MGPGERSDFSPLLDAEALGSVAAAQGFEPLVRDARRPGHELKQTEPLLVGEALDGLPEPRHHGVVVVVTAAVLGVSAPVAAVDLEGPGYHKLQVLGIEG